MADPKWQGKVVMSRSGQDTPASLAWIWGSNGEFAWDRSFEFFQKLADHRPKIARSNRPGSEQVALGESAVQFITPGGPPSQLSLQGAPISATIFPKTFSGYRTLSLVQDAPHSAAGWLFIDYLLSPEGQFEYTDRISAILPVNQKARPGRLAQWGIERGAKPENIVVTPPDEVTRVFTDDVFKKSEEFYFRTLGIR
jgi:ABC-type Fe3+ transport system substrate-binding protein